MAWSQNARIATSMDSRSLVGSTNDQHHREHLRVHLHTNALSLVGEWREASHIFAIAASECVGWIGSRLSAARRSLAANDFSGVGGAEAALSRHVRKLPAYLAEEVRLGFHA